MADYNLLHRELADLASALSPQADLHDGLHRLSIATATALELDGAGVTVQVPGLGTHYLTGSDPTTLHVEWRQDELHEGACVDAMARSEIVAVSDLTAEQPWPRFTPVLLEAGYHAAAGAPISFQGSNIGAVNLYAKDSRAWTTEDFTAARLVANLAAGYLVNREVLRTTQTLAEQLQFALDSRIIIEQAKGKLAGIYGMAPDAAFDVMRDFARSRRTKLHKIAHSVMSGHLDLLRESSTANLDTQNAES